MVRKERKVESSKREQSDGHTRWHMKHKMEWVRTQTWAMLVHSLWKMDVWGVVFTPPGCSRLLPALNDLTATNLKNLESRHVWGFVTRRHSQRVSPFYHVALYMSSVADLLFICHELHQESFHCHQVVLEEELDDGCHCYISRMELAWVVLLQILGEDGLLWSTHCWSQDDFSLVRFFQTYWERSTNSFCIESTHLASSR